MKKLKKYIALLIVLIIIAIILMFFVVKKSIEGYRIEMTTEDVVKRIETAAISVDKLNINNLPEDTTISKEINEQIKGYDVIGIIKIPKIDLSYPILDETNNDSLKLSITKYFGDKINKIGSVVLAGHNNLNNKMFGRIDELEDGDIIELTDKQMVTVKYQVFNKYVTTPNDVSCILPQQENMREVTLITCDNGNKSRLIVKAKEII